jgi:hypothetical protein
MTLVTRYLTLAVLGLAGGAQTLALAAAPTRTIESPFAFCQRVGTDDRLSHSRAAANSAEAAVLKRYLPNTLGLTPDAVLPPNSMFWRCMEGKLYLCIRGANIPCDSKADRSLFNRGAMNYCRNNPNADAVPAYAAGHRSVYCWRCVQGHAEHGPVVAATDMRGYRIDFWHLIDYP